MTAAPGIGYVPDWLPKATPAAAPAAPKVTAPPRRPRGRTASYDAAQTNPTDRHHWTAADDQSAAAANSPEVRAVLRRRSRYECANNGYLNGLIQTLAHDLIGSGPRLQLAFPDDAGDPTRLYELAREVEKAFAAWSRAVGLADKLRVMHEAQLRDGEAFAVLVTNPAVPHPVKLDLSLVECDRVCDPTWAADPTPGDGISYDAAGNPTSYKILKNHPGDLVFPPLFAAEGDYDVIPARLVLHWFRCDRPGQLRGVPTSTPMLPLGSQLRRYTLATLTSAEYAASVAGIVYTDAPPPGEEPAEFAAFDEVEVVRGKLLTMPNQWKMNQLTAEQPTSSYPEFKHEILNEMGRPFNAPFNVIAGNSSGYNYSSGRLDHQIYHRSAWTNRERLRHKALDRVFWAFVAEYAALGLLSEELPATNLWEHDFHWDGFTSIDPLKDANATKAELALGVTTLAAECAARGLDWRETLKQRAAEREYAVSLGLNPDAGTDVPPWPPELEAPPPPARPPARPTRNGTPRREPARG
jgi:capsid protein